MDKNRDILFRHLGLLLAFAFMLASTTSAICPICAPEGLVPSQHLGIHNTDHHRGGPDCDRDGCSCCGFQFLTAVRQTTLVSSESSPKVALPELLELREYPSDFYHPPRA